MLHHLVQTLKPESTDFVQEVLDRLHTIVDKEGPFDGILGNSEGATLAATFLVDCLRKSQNPFKCAIFMSGNAPYFPDGTGLFLADDYGQLITIPTCHIIGYNDSLIDAAVALYHLCDQDAATIVDHGKGHMVPRDPKSSKVMIKGIRDTIARASDNAEVCETS